MSPDPNDPNGVNMIEKIRVAKFCQGTIIDDHWIITTATCCTEHYMNPNQDYGRAYVNFGALTSPYTAADQDLLRYYIKINIINII